MHITQKLQSWDLSQRNGNLCSHKCTQMFIAAEFIIASNQKQLTCPATREWFDKLWHNSQHGILLSSKKEMNTHQLGQSPENHTEGKKADHRQLCSITFHLLFYLYNILDGTKL